MQTAPATTTASHPSIDRTLSARITSVSIPRKPKASAIMCASPAVIAKDGFSLAQPQDQDTVVVSPGERYTVLVHADTAGAWAWHCHVLSHAERSDGMFGMVTAMVVR